MAKTDAAEGDAVTRTSVPAGSRRNTHSFLIPSSGHHDISSGNNSIHWPAGCRRSAAQIRACCRVNAFFRECDASLNTESWWAHSSTETCLSAESVQLRPHIKYCPAIPLHIHRLLSAVHTKPIQFITSYLLKRADPSRHVFQGVGLRPLYCWDGGSKFRWEHDVSCHCCVRWTSLRRADHSSRGALLSVVCLLFRNLDREAWTQYGCRSKEKNP
jgi:hypothetical protein